MTMSRRKRRLIRWYRYALRYQFGYVGQWQYGERQERPLGIERAYARVPRGQRYMFMDSRYVPHGFVWDDDQATWLKSNHGCVDGD